MHLSTIWVERITLLQVYFNHFITKQGTILKDICFKQGTQFCSTCSSSGLIYYGPANWSFRSYFVFFSNQFFQKNLKIFLRSAVRKLGGIW